MAKYYLSVGIGDMVALDSILTKEEKEDIEEIYWACRFGENLREVMDNNPAYPNLRGHHLIPDEAGQAAMEAIQPEAVPFWHFRPDFHPNYEVGKRLLGIEDDEVKALDVAGMFLDPNRTYQGTSFLFDEVPFMHNYVLVHYPTSTRPRQYITDFTRDDWYFVDKIAKENNYDIVVVADKDVWNEIPWGLESEIHMAHFSLRGVFNLATHCNIYAGCDSFCAGLAAKHLPEEHLWIKDHPAAGSGLPHFFPHTNRLYKSFS